MKRKNNAEQVQAPKKTIKKIVESKESPEKERLNKWFRKLKNMLGLKEGPENERLNKWFWILIVVVLSLIILIQAARDSLDKYVLLSVAIFLIVMISLIAIIWYAPRRYVRSLQNKDGGNLHSEFEHEKEQLKLEDSTRKTFAQIIGGGIFLFGLLFTYNTFLLNREGQITDRFSKAVDLLGKEDVGVRLGGLYALERIAKDSPKDHWTIMEILCAYIRERSPNKRPRTAANPAANTNQNTAPAANPVENEPVKTDVKVAFTIILRRVANQDPEKGRLDLMGVNLKGISLMGVYIDTANLSKAKLSDSDLRNADLSGLDFSGADLTKADLSGANLTGTNFLGADLTETSIKEANLLAAKLAGAVLRRADFTGATLQGSDFTEAKLNDAILPNASLDRTKFYAADLTGIRGLTFEKIRDTETEIDIKTILPDYLANKKDDLLDIIMKRRKEESEREKQKGSFLNRFKPQPQ